MKQRISNLFVLVLVSAAFTAPGVAQDNIRITGAFTNFTGTVFGANVVTNPNGGGSGTFMSYCGGFQCIIPAGAPAPIICPDLGCSTDVGLVTGFPLGLPKFDTNSSVSFWTAGNTVNNLTFAVNHSTNSFPLQVDPTGEFKLGTLSFTNGTWISNAIFGFSIVVEDDNGFSQFAGVHTFTGFVNLSLTAPPAGATPAENADFIYLTDANGNAVVNPITLQPLPSVRVYEAFDSPIGTNVGTVTLWGKFGSLDLTRISDPTGGAFLDVSLTNDLGGPPPQTAIYNVCPLYDQSVAKKVGSAYPIKIQLCDASGNNLSSSSIAVKAVSVTRVSGGTPPTVDDTGNANPDSDFRYDATLAGYIFNLSTTGYTTGTYILNFIAGADPAPHSAQFAVK